MHNPKRLNWQPAGLFLLLTLAFSSIFWSLIIHTGKLESGFKRYLVGLMWSPGLAALATCRLLRYPVASLGWRWDNGRLLLASYLLPLLYALAAYLLVWAAGWGGFCHAGYVTQVTAAFGLEGLPAALVIGLYGLLTGILGLPTSAAAALGEEIGFRGLLVPVLYSRLGFTGTALLTGFIWAGWHYPLLLFTDYHSGTPAWYSLSCFTVMVVGLSFILTWFRLRSGNLWTCTLLHASHNLFVQAVFAPLTQDTGLTRYFVGEFGAVLPVVTAAVALYCWSRRPTLAARAQSSPSV